MKFNYLQ